MTLTTVVVAVAVVVFLVARRVRGEAVREPRRLFLLPIVIGLIGLENVSHAKPNTVGIAFVVAGAVVSLGLGLLRGRLDRVTLVDGSAFMRWSTGSVVVFAVNLITKVALDAAGVAAGGTRSAVSASIMLSLGLALFGEAAVVWMRAQSLGSGGSGAPGATGSGQYRGTVQPSDRPTQWPPIR